MMVPWLTILRGKYMTSKRYHFPLFWSYILSLLGHDEWPRGMRTDGGSPSCPVVLNTIICNPTRYRNRRRAAVGTLRPAQTPLHCPDFLIVPKERGNFKSSRRQSRMGCGEGKERTDAQPCGVTAASARRPGSWRATSESCARKGRDNPWGKIKTGT